MRSDAVAALGLGSNIADRLEHLQAAVDLLAPLAVSPVYETAPVGGPEQGPYLNAVVLVAASDPVRLLRQAQAVEAARDRVRAERWGPRTLDVDLLDVGGMVLDTPELTLPHPRAAYRTFVLAPWLDVAPEAVIPRHGRVADLLQRRGPGWGAADRRSTGAVNPTRPRGLVIAGALALVVSYLLMRAVLPGLAHLSAATDAGAVCRDRRPGGGRARPRRTCPPGRPAGHQSDHADHRRQVRRPGPGQQHCRCGGSRRLGWGTALHGPAG